MILPLVKWVHFFLGPWLLVCQFIEISNQMEVNGEVTNFGWKNLFNTLLYKNFFSKFETWPFTSIWLEISINWYTKSQGPKKNCTHFTKGRIHSCPAGTARNKGGFTTHALWSVQSFNSPTVYFIFPFPTPTPCSLMFFAYTKSQDDVDDSSKLVFETL